MNHSSTQGSLSPSFSPSRSPELVDYGSGIPYYPNQETKTPPPFEKRGSTAGSTIIGKRVYTDYVRAGWFDFTLRVLIPSITSPIILACAWFATIYFRSERDAVNSFATFVQKSPQYITYIFTAAATILTAAVGWSFGAAVAYLLSKRMVTRSVRVASLQTWVNLATLKRDRITFAGWRFSGILITALITILLAATTPGFTTLLTPRRLIRTVNSAGSATGALELNLNTAAFDNLVASTAYTYDQCSYWPKSRGFETQGCPFSNALPLLLQNGRAAVESWKLIDIATFARIGTLTMDGSSGGTIPFTSLAPVMDPATNGDNSINFEHTIPKLALAATKFNITQTLQGSSADVNCEWQAAADSPLKSTLTDNSGVVPKTQIMTTSISCDSGSTSSVQTVGDLRVAAGICLVTDSGRGWNLYLQLDGLYASQGTAGTQHNLVCTITPFITATTVVFHSATNSSSIVSVIPDKGSARGLALQAFLDATVRNLAYAFQSGQSQTINLVMESVQGLFSAYPRIDRLRIWEQFFQGLIELSGSYLRHTWEEIAFTPASRTLKDFDSASVMSRVPVSITYESFGWKSAGWLSYVSLAPLSILTLIAIICNLRAAFTPVDLPSFDPTDLGALVLASGRGDLHRLDEMKLRGTHDDALMQETKVRFAPNGNGGDFSKPWGLVSRYED